MFMQSNANQAKEDNDSAKQNSSARRQHDLDQDRPEKHAPWLGSHGKNTSAE
jgi:hypothetical protein